MPHHQSCMLASICLPSTAGDHLAAGFDLEQPLFITGLVGQAKPAGPQISDQRLQVSLSENARRDKRLGFELIGQIFENPGARSFYHEMPMLLLRFCSSLKANQNIDGLFLRVRSRFNLDIQAGATTRSLGKAGGPAN